MKVMKTFLRTLTTGALMLSLLAGCTNGPTKETSTSTNSSKPTSSNSSEVADNTSNATSNQDTDDILEIGVIQYIKHPSLDTIYASFEAQLEELGYQDGVNCEIDLKDAQGDQSNCNSIVQAFKADKKDVIVAIATPAAQAAATVAKDIPIIFSAVTDPVEAGLVTSMEQTDKNITGTSDAVQVDDILDLALQFYPKLNRIGFLYSTGEANSVSNLQKAKEFCEDRGMQLIESGVSNSSEVQQAAQVLFTKVDALFIPNDNTVASAMPMIAQEAIKAQIPVFTGADSMVGDGGLATNGIEYTALGAETANMVDKVAKGTPISEIPVKVFDDNLSIFVNENTAKALEIEIPQEISSNEHYVVKNTNE